MIQGKWPFSEPPFGWYVDANGFVKQDSNEQEIAREALYLRSAGYTYREINIKLKKKYPSESRLPDARDFFSARKGNKHRTKNRRNGKTSCKFRWRQAGKRLLMFPFDKYTLREYGLRKEAIQLKLDSSFVDVEFPEDKQLRLV
jgi:hypothetical protein